MTGGMRLRLTALMLVVGALVLAPSSVQAQATNVEVRMTDFSFDPMEIELPLGATVTWIYDDTQCDVIVVCPGHDTMAEVNGPGGEPLWKSETIKGEGATFTATMTQVGEIPYICTIHQSALADMDGVVTVVAAETATPGDDAAAPAPAPSELPVTGGPALAAAAGLAALLIAVTLRVAARPPRATRR